MSFDWQADFVKNKKGVLFERPIALLPKRCFALLFIVYHKKTCCQ